MPVIFPSCPPSSHFSFLLYGIVAGTMLVNSACGGFHRALSLPNNGKTTSCLWGLFPQITLISSEKAVLLLDFYSTIEMGFALKRASSTPPPSTMDFLEFLKKSTRILTFLVLYCTFQRFWTDPLAEGGDSALIINPNAPFIICALSLVAKKRKRRLPWTTMKGGFRASRVQNLLFCSERLILTE